MTIETTIAEIKENNAEAMRLCVEGLQTMIECLISLRKNNIEISGLLKHFKTKEDK